MVPVPQRCGPAGHSTSQQARHGLAERPTGEGGCTNGLGSATQGPAARAGPLLPTLSAQCRWEIPPGRSRASGHPLTPTCHYPCAGRRPRQSPSAPGQRNLPLWRLGVARLRKFTLRHLSPGPGTKHTRFETRLAGLAPELRYRTGWRCVGSSSVTGFRVSLGLTRSGLLRPAQLGPVARRMLRCAVSRVPHRSAPRAAVAKPCQAAADGRQP